MGLSVKIALFVIIALLILTVVGRYYSSVSPRPSQVGVGIIAPCPNSPNCVSSQAENEGQKIEPISIRSSSTETLDALEKVIGEMPNSTVVTRTDSYLYVEFRSSFWNFIDDAEFFVNAEDNVVEVRSSARIGYSDGGVNRARYRKIIRTLNSQ